jgi:hypothetical protein
MKTARRASATGRLEERGTDCASTDTITDPRGAMPIIWNRCARERNRRNKKAPACTQCRGFRMTYRMARNGPSGLSAYWACSRESKRPLLPRSSLAQGDETAARGHFEDEWAHRSAQTKNPGTDVVPGSHLFGGTWFNWRPIAPACGCAGASHSRPGRRHRCRAG